MATFNQEFADTPTMISDMRRFRRIQLIFEEFIELMEGMGFALTMGLDDADKIKIRIERQCQPDIEKIYDALIDLDVMLTGAANEFGLDLEPGIREVFENNMTKLWTYQELGQIPDGWTCEDKGDGKFVVKDQNGKFRKPPSWQPPDLRSVIEGLGFKFPKEEEEVEDVY